jgi:RimJ/RimL family protein N-acetyltransferase
MAGWSPFDAVLYSDANWAQRSSRELDRWYAHNSQDHRRLLFSVNNKNGQVLGSITLREIDRRHSARLGITLGPQFVSQGYGTEALSLFLDYYFTELGFAKMLLDVTAHNRRAVHVYDKLGFKTMEEKERPAGGKVARQVFKNPDYRHIRQFFRRDWFGRYWVSYYEMELDRQTWKNSRVRVRRLE